MELSPSHQKVRRIIEAALERGALDPVALDVGAVTSFADCVVVLSGRSDRQVRAIADAIVHALRGDEESCARLLGALAAEGALSRAEVEGDCDLVPLLPTAWMQSVLHDAPP